MRLLQKLPNVSNVAAGAQVTINCPLGYRYDQIELVHNIANLAHLKNIEVVVNGKSIQTFKDAAEVKSLNDFYGRFEATGFLSLWFQRPEMATPMDRRICGLGTLDIETLSIKFDIDAAAASPSVEAYAHVGPNEPMGLITKVKSFVPTFGAAGQVEIDNIVKAGRIAAIHLYKADITAVTVEVNSRKVYEATKALGEKVQKEHGRVPQSASAVHVDFCLEGDVAEALITAQVYDLRVRPTISTGGQIRAVVEYFDGFAGI